MSFSINFFSISPSWTQGRLPIRFRNHPSICILNGLLSHICLSLMMTAGMSCRRTSHKNHTQKLCHLNLCPVCELNFYWMSWWRWWLLPFSRPSNKTKQHSVAELFSLKYHQELTDHVNDHPTEVQCSLRTFSNFAHNSFPAINSTNTYILILKPINMLFLRSSLAFRALRHCLAASRLSWDVVTGEVASTLQMMLKSSHYIKT